jgi:hypothetical protein
VFAADAERYETTCGLHLCWDNEPLAAILEAALHDYDLCPVTAFLGIFGNAQALEGRSSNK